jgi:hypothetical protein
LSRTWIVKAEQSPDTPGDIPPGAHHDYNPIPYPFNGMGGYVASGPHATREEAEDAESSMWE